MSSDRVIQLKRLFREHANPEHAAPMEQYMKNNFLFLGIKSPERKMLTKTFLKETKLDTAQRVPADELQTIWDLPEREFQYTVIEILARLHKVYLPEDLAFFERLIVSKSWWDSVDSLAPHVVGSYFLRFPAQIERASEWSTHSNMWLRRSAILFQLKYKEKTDEERLFRYIKENAEDKEFFIRKAIGWALREYSKTESDRVERFIFDESLSNLSKKEGLKHIERQRKRNEA
ncbi:DNA alkylation repair protein [Alteribacter populi]|uniref:DNA alkylation repair protein n=1 Tax=Alteribacter populi TaxID=2011011 RepID=UPI001E3D3F79|nr:DNA alkylation repair protein [Alteribacter populi]